MESTAEKYCDLNWLRRCDAHLFPRDNEPGLLHHGGVVWTFANIDGSGFCVAKKERQAVLKAFKGLNE